MFSDFIEFSVPIFKSVSVLILIVAYFVWLERKVAARIQSRIGPYLVGKPHGWLQPLADALKFSGAISIGSVLAALSSMPFG